MRNEYLYLRNELLLVLHKKVPLCILETSLITEYYKSTAHLLSLEAR